jgi:hypothetical protein
MIEPLESRIAPAAIIFTATSFGSVYKNSKGVVELQFINAAHAVTTVDKEIAKTVSDSPTVFFIEVTAGEEVKIPTPVGYEDLINVSAGTVVAFFTDPGAKASDPVLGSELTGLSLSTQVSVAIGNGINKYQVGGTGPYYGGDVVTNFNTKTGEIGGTSTNQLLANTVTDLSVAGPITGAFISGGNVSRLEATGNVHEILTGTAANTYSAFNFGGGPSPAANKLVVPTPLAGVAGPSLSNVIIGSTGLLNPANGVVAPGVIKLGAGGPGTPGGSLTGLILLDDTVGFTVQAGAGGAGGKGRAYGGAGGSITDVLVEGPSSGDTSSNSNEILEAGAGGAGVGTAGGGNGGSIGTVFIDFTAFNINNPDNPDALMADNVAIVAGAGGTGGAGGAGGTLNNVNVLTATPHDANTARTPFPLTGYADEYVLLGGAGGLASATGRGGAGGAITNSYVDNHDLPTVANIPGITDLPEASLGTSPTNAHALIQAGAGGSSKRASGGAGGAVDVLTLRGYNFQVAGGAGGDGLGYGAAGGAISTVTVLGSNGDLPGDNFHAETLAVTGGAGGTGTNAAGGAGGALGGLIVENADFGLTGMVASGGAGGNGKTAGGAGGAVLGVSVTTVDFATDTNPAGYTGPINIASGNGGNAPASMGHGGVGGAVSNVNIVATRISSTSVSAGDGGSGGVSGSIPGFGGAGGTIMNVAIRATDPSNTTASTGLLLDSKATFVTDGIAVNDVVENETTGATTLVKSVTQTELTLASDIFAAGDSYLVTSASGTDAGVAQASQDTIVDSSDNFTTEGVKVGDVFEDLTTYNRDTLVNETSPYTVTVTAVTAHTLTVSGDISHVGDQYAIPAVLPVLGNATVTAGSGGAGGKTGYGGAGGAILGSSANADGTVTFNGGTGGAAGIGAAAGAGGTLNGDGALSTNGSGLLFAGNAGEILPARTGPTGGRAGAGGSIIGANVQALVGVSLIAGNGSAGGAGGSVTQSGFTGAPSAGGGLSLAPPLGNITVQGGAGGSSLARAGGAGGSVNLLTGFISSGNGASSITTQFDGGDGGSGHTSGGAGGSVSNVRIFGGGGADVTFFIDAGDAGNGTTAGTGATGGSVSNIAGGANSSGSGVADFSISSLTDFHHISAGNGGNASLHGGLGGSVSEVYVNAVIGIRTGAAFGFNLAGAGGISAGAGGTGSKTHGAAGNVTTIAADAIASIVAGHLTTGQGLEAANLATKVDNIILNGLNAPSLVQTVDFTFDGETTVTVPTNAPAIEVADALNALESVQLAGGVSVVASGTGYVVTFKSTGVQTALIGQEPAMDTDGTTTEVVQGTDFGGPTLNGTQEVQNIQATLSPFALSFGGETTTLLPKNATPAEVAAALNALPAIQAEKNNFIDPGVNPDVTVVENNSTSNPSYTVTFGVVGPQPLISDPIYYPYTHEQVRGSATTDEVQNVQVFGVNPFSLSFGGDTTARLPAKATAAQVMTALNALPTIDDAGGVTVTYTAGTSTTNPSYNISFNDPGLEAAIVPNFGLSLATKAGTTTTSQVDTLTFPTRGDISPVQFATANFVGSIENVLQPDATKFHYTGSPAAFKFGDAPVDGLIAALTLTADKNFVPEAFVTSESGTALLVDPTTS